MTQPKVPEITQSVALFLDSIELQDTGAESVDPANGAIFNFLRVARTFLFSEISDNLIFR
jgi:hypothetical protein